MKKFIQIFTFFASIAVIFTPIFSYSQNSVGIGTSTPDASAKLDITATDKGLLIPRMTTTARNGITSPAKGLMVYDSTAKAFYYHNGTVWSAVGAVSTNSFPSIELRVTKTAAQTLAGTDISVAQTTTGEAIVYSATNDTHAVLTGGNTWDGTTFTIGSAGSGWYQLTSNLMAYNTVSNTTNQHISMLIEINGMSASSIFGTVATSLGNVALPQFSIRSVATGVVYLSSGDVIKIKAKGSSTTANLAIRVDGSTNFSVVRLK